MDLLTTNLLDLLHELDGRNIPIMIGGGYGLVLKRQHLIEIGARMLLTSLPEPRATNDLDMFLRAELLSDLQRTHEFREVIVRLGYTPVEEARFFQWKRLIVVAVEGLRSNGEPYQGSVEVPEAFPYLMMKLHAFADRKMDGNKDLGRHHALDVYTIVAMMTEPEYNRARQIATEQANNQNVRRARDIVRQDFSGETSLGILRVREHQLFGPNFQIQEFLDVLQEIFSDE